MTSPKGACYRIDRVEFDRVQILIWLRLEVPGGDGPTEDEKGISYVVRVTLPEAPATIQSLVAAYTTGMTHVATELACGGCTTCQGKRWVDNERCPVCWPRGKKRLSAKVFGIIR